MTMRFSLIFYKPVDKFGLLTDEKIFASDEGARIIHSKESAGKSVGLGTVQYWF